MLDSARCSEVNFNVHRSTFKLSSFKLGIRISNGGDNIFPEPPPPSPFDGLVGRLREVTCLPCAQHSWWCTELDGISILQLPARSQSFETRRHVREGSPAAFK